MPKRVLRAFTYTPLAIRVINPSFSKMASSLVTYSTSYWGKEETKNISPNLLRVILFLICCTTAFSIDFVYKIMVGMITNISDRKDAKFLLYNNTLSVEIKFHWQIIAFFLLYRWHSYINNVSLFTLTITARAWGASPSRTQRLIWGGDSLRVARA